MSLNPSRKRSLPFFLGGLATRRLESVFCISTSAPPLIRVVRGFGLLAAG